MESYAKSNSPTLTGKIVYRFADMFIVQWEEMKHIYPKALYLGSIY
nr:UDP-N-acetylglucosamine transferase subunit ALG14 [Weissella confusa]